MENKEAMLMTRVDSNLKKRFKIAAAKRGVSMSEVVDKLIRDWLSDPVESAREVILSLQTDTAAAAEIDLYDDESFNDAAEQAYVDVGKASNEVEINKVVEKFRALCLKLSEVQA